MKTKLGWILFSIMTVVVIILSSMLISYDVRWKSGNEILDIDFEDIQSAYIYHNILATAQPEIEEYDLNEAQIKYIITEFRNSRFEIDNSHYDEGSSGVILKLKDGSECVFNIIGSGITIEGQQYKCYSYLTKYINDFGRNCND